MDCSLTDWLKRVISFALKTPAPPTEGSSDTFDGKLLTPAGFQPARRTALGCLWGRWPSWGHLGTMLEAQTTLTQPEGWRLARCCVHGKSKSLPRIPTAMYAKTQMMKRMQQTMSVQPLKRRAVRGRSRNKSQ